MTAPSAQRERHDAAYAGIECDKWGEAFFGDPVNGGSGSMLMHVGDERKCVDDISKRRRTNDEDRRHAAAPAFRQRGQSPGETS